MYICNYCCETFEEPNFTADYDYSGGVKTEIPCTDEELETIKSGGML